jgi:hypothetical protein
LQILNIISFTAVIAVNWLANHLPLNGYTTGEVSARYSNLFTPAGVTFAIWGVIYAALAGFVIYQACGLIASKQPLVKLLNKIGYLFVISSAANIGWLFAWHYLRMVLSFVVMIILVGTLTVIYHLRLDVGRREVDGKKKWLVQVPFSLYKAWITVASVANFMVLTRALNWDQGLISAEMWAVAAITVVILLGIYIYRARGDVWFELVFIWVLLGIVIKRVSVADKLVVSVAGAAALGILILVGNMIYVKLFKQIG